MELKLKMVADSGNDAVLKQLTTQVHDAFDKMVKDTEHLGEKLVKKSHGWAKSIGESMSKALEKASAQVEKLEAKASSQRESPKTEGSSPESRESKHSESEPEAHPEPAKPSNNPQAEASGRSQEVSKEKKSEEPAGKEKTSRVENVLIVAEKGVSFTKHVSAAFDSEKGKLERAEEVVGAAKDAHELYKTGKELFDSFKGGAKTAATVANTAETATTAVGLGGTIKNLGGTALAGLGGWGGIGAAAQIAGIGAVAVAGGVALHDGVKLLLNKVGFLGGHFDTLSGTVLEWNESTKRSAEIEKKIAETQEAHQQALEQMQRNQQNTRSVYEARARIEEAEQFKREAVGMVPTAARYAKRLASDKQQVGTERELQKEDKAFARDDRLFAKERYAAKFDEKGRAQDSAADVASKTKQNNEQRKSKALGPVDLQEQLLQEEKAVKLANDLRNLARDRSAELQNQLQTMEQQVRAAKHQVAAAQEQVKAEQDKVNSQKAHLSMLAQGEQKSAATILKKFNQTKHLNRDDALTLQKLGITQGEIGRAINATLAKGLDPEFAKQFKAAGGEEGLDLAQQHLKDSTEDLAAAQKEAEDTFDDLMDSIWDFAGATDTAVAALKKYEGTKADKEGYSRPDDLRPGEKPKETQSAVQTVKDAIQASQADFAAAIKEIGNAMATGAKKNAADLRGVAVQLNQAHKVGS
jgi:hypothetical protein